MKGYTKYNGWCIEHGIGYGKNLPLDYYRNIYADLENCIIYGGPIHQRGWWSENESDDLFLDQIARRHPYYGADTIITRDELLALVPIQKQRADNLAARIAEEEKAYRAQNDIWEAEKEASERKEFLRIEAEEIAEHIRCASGKWNLEMCGAICELADMSEEWVTADGEAFEAVVYMAAERLGVSLD